MVKPEFTYVPCDMCKKNVTKKHNGVGMVTPCESCIAKYRPLLKMYGTMSKRTSYWARPRRKVSRRKKRK